MHPALSHLNKIIEALSPADAATIKSWRDTWVKVGSVDQIVNPLLEDRAKAEAQRWQWEATKRELGKSVATDGVILDEVHLTTDDGVPMKNLRATVLFLAKDPIV